MGARTGGGGLLAGMVTGLGIVLAIPLFESGLFNGSTPLDCMLEQSGSATSSYAPDKETLPWHRPG